MTEEERNTEKQEPGDIACNALAHAAALMKSKTGCSTSIALAYLTTEAIKAVISADRESGQAFIASIVDMMMAPDEQWDEKADQSAEALAPWLKVAEEKEDVSRKMVIVRFLADVLGGLRGEGVS